MYDFKEQLALGKLGEEFILQAHPELRPAPERQRKYDLFRPSIVGSVETIVERIEVKTDQSPLRSTGNFFMERRTAFHTRGRAPLEGGPWRSVKDGCDTFVYLYANGGTLEEPAPPVAFWFRDIPRLVAELEALISVRPRVVFPRRVRNLKVSAQGYLVRRDVLLVRLGDSVEEIRYEPKAPPAEPAKEAA